MDPLFEPIFDIEENMDGHPFGYFRREHFPGDDIFQSEIERHFSSIFRDFVNPYSSFLFHFGPRYIPDPFPKGDYILDNESDNSLFPDSSLPSTFSHPECHHYESIRTSVRQPDGVIIRKDITIKDGREVINTTTIYPDGRQESTSETREGALTVNYSPAIITPHSYSNNSGIGGAFSNFRRWLGI